MSASGEIFKLFGYIAINGIDKAYKQFEALDSSAAKVYKTLDKVSKAANSIGRTFTASLTVPITAVAGAIGALASKTGQYADKLLDLQQITGLSTDEIQKYEYVARVAGVSSDGFLNVITKLSNELPNIAQGTGTAAVALDKLGVNVLDVNGNVRDMNTLFPTIIKSLQGIQNVTERNALAQDIFGKSLKDVAPILGMSADEMERAKFEAEKLGLVMSKDAINSANNFRIGMEKLKAQFAAVGRELATNLFPILNEQLIPLIQTTLIPAIRGLVDLLSGLISMVNMLPGPLQKVVIGLVAVVAAIGPGALLLGKFTLAIKGAYGGLMLLSNAVGGTFVKAITGLGGPIRAAIAAVQGLGAAMGATTAVVVASGALMVAALVAIIAPLVILRSELKSLKKTKEMAEMGEQLQTNAKAALEAAVAQRKLAGTAEYDAEKHIELEKALIKAQIAQERLTVAAMEHSKSITSEQAAEKMAALALKEADLMMKKEQQIRSTVQVTEAAAAKQAKIHEDEANALKKRKEDLAAFLTAQKDAADQILMTEMELLAKQEAADLAKAKKLGANEAQMQTVRDRYAVERQKKETEANDKIAKINAEWQEKLVHQTGDKAAILEADRKKAIAEASGADIQAIEQYYANERKKLIEEQQAIEKKYAVELQEAKRNIEIEGAKRTADSAERELQERHRVAMANAARNGQDIRALQIAQDTELATLRVDNAKKIADLEFDAKKEALQEQYTAEIEAAEKEFADTTAIRERYGLEFQNLEEQRIAAARSAEEQITDIVRDNNEKRAALNKSYVSGFVNSMVGAVNQLGSIMSKFSSNEEKRISKQYQDERARIEATVTDEEERKAKLEALAEEEDAKKLEIQKEQARREKALGIFNAVINTAQAIVKALAELGPIFGPIMAVAMGALGAAQIAAINSEPEPFFDGGLIQGSPAGIHAQVGERNQDELIMPLDRGVEMLAEKLNGIGGAGGDSYNYQVDVHVGTLIADDNGIKQLGRKIREVIISEERRTGV